jgi:hypothetical protein
MLTFTSLPGLLNLRNSERAIRTSLNVDKKRLYDTNDMKEATTSCDSRELYLLQKLDRTLNHEVYGNHAQAKNQIDENVDAIFDIFEALDEVRS